ncbi:MAG: thioredoxin [Lewinella sp.]|nr:thioredoxin [Lewinella sp.]
MTEKKTSSFRKLIDGETPVLVDFFATWCGPCHAYSPILAQLKADLGDDLRLVKIDVDRNEEICQKLGVSSMPTTIIFQNGELKFRAAGVQPISVLKAELSKLTA